MFVLCVLKLLTQVGIWQNLFDLEVLNFRPLFVDCYFPSLIAPLLLNFLSQKYSIRHKTPKTPFYISAEFN